MSEEESKLDDGFERLQTAMFNTSLPCNPLPFLAGLRAIASVSSSAVQSDRYKSILWVLLAQTYGSLSTIDLTDEWSRLYEIQNANSNST